MKFLILAKNWSKLIDSCILNINLMLEMIFVLSNTQLLKLSKKYKNEGFLLKYNESPSPIVYIIPLWKCYESGNKFIDFWNVSTKRWIILKR